MRKDKNCIFFRIASVYLNAVLFVFWLFSNISPGHSKDKIHQVARGICPNWFIQSYLVEYNWTVI